MKRLILLFLFISLSATAQRNTRYNLLEKLDQHTKTDTVRVNLLNLITRKFWGTEPHKNLEYAEEALKISQELHYQKGIANSYREISRYYWSQTEYTKAMDFALLAQETYKVLGDSIGISWSYGTIGLSYSQANNYEKAIEYQKKALQLNTQLNYNLGVARDLNNLGYIYELMKDYSSARDYYTKSLTMRMEIGDSTEMLIPLINVGAINVTQKNYRTAKEYLQRALTLAELLHNKNMIALVHQNLGTIADEEGTYNKALEHFNYALKIAQEIGDKKRKEGLYEAMQKMEETHKNYKAAYEYAQQLRLLRDTLYSQEQSMKMAEMDARAEREKKEQALALLEKDRRIQTLWTNILLAGILLLIVAFVLIYWWQRYRERKNLEFLSLQVDLLTGHNKALAEKYKQALIEKTVPSVESADQRLLRTALEIVEKNIADPNFGVEQMAEEIAMSRGNLHRKLKHVTGFAPGDFIRHIRLKRAAHLLLNNTDSVTQIGFCVGFDDQSYFSKSFKKQFGVAPSEYAKSTIEL